MHRVVALLAVSFLYAVGHAAEPAPAPRLEPAALFSVRDGLPNLAGKLQAGTPVSVVFIGGSITEAATSPKGFITFVTGWLAANHPRAKATVVNAGISGTGSDFGAARCDRDILVHKPDAVFIEFAVNDGVQDRTVHMERLVHKIWTRDPATDIVFFYTLASTHLPHYKDGLLPPAASAHERVAAFYGIPTIGTGFLAASRINAGTITWDQFSPDGCHPRPLGYEIFGEAFAQALPELLKAAPAKAHTLGRSITPNLRVYPPKRIAKPLSAGGELLSATGERATVVYPLPIPGVNWVDTPVFNGADGAPLWRLSWLPISQGGKLDPKIGADRAAWADSTMTWFEEYAYFHGPRGTALFGQHRDKAKIGFGKEITVLRFIAPAAGRHVVVAKSGRWTGWQGEDKEMSLAILRFPKAGGPGEPLAFSKQVKKTATGLDLDLVVTLEAGDEVAFIPDGTCWGGSHWEDFTASVGRLGN